MPRETPKALLNYAPRDTKSTTPRPHSAAAAGAVFSRRHWSAPCPSASPHRFAPAAPRLAANSLAYSSVPGDDGSSFLRPLNSLKGPCALRPSAVALSTALGPVYSTALAPPPPCTSSDITPASGRGSGVGFPSPFSTSPETCLVAVWGERVGMEGQERRE